MVTITLQFVKIISDLGSGQKQFLLNIFALFNNKVQFSAT